MAFGLTHALQHFAVGVASAGVAFGLGLWLSPQTSWLDVDPLPLTPVPRVAGVVAKAGGVLQRQDRGGWVDVDSGEQLIEGVRLRAGAASFAWLDLSDRARLQVAAESEVVVVVTPTGARLELLRGAVRVPADAAGAIELGAGDVLATDHAIVRADSGPLAVVVGVDGLRVHSEGAGGAVVVVGAQQLSLATGDSVRAAPGQAAELIAAPVLTLADLAPPVVARPVVKVPKLARGETTVISGRVADLKGKGGADIAVVKIGDVTAEVAADGTFRAVVPLKIGMNAIAILTRDVFGNEAIYEIDPVRRLSDAEVRALKFEWQRKDTGANTTWGAP